MIAFSTVPTFTVRFPAGDRKDSLLYVVIHIQDVLHCVREVNMSSLIVSVDSEGINHLMNSFQNSPAEMNQNPYIQLLSSENQNVVGQVVSSLSQEINQMNDHNVDTALSSKFFLLNSNRFRIINSRWNTSCRYFHSFIRKFKFITSNTLINEELNCISSICIALDPFE